MIDFINLQYVTISGENVFLYNDKPYTKIKTITAILVADGLTDTQAIKQIQKTKKQFIKFGT